MNIYINNDLLTEIKETLNEQIVSGQNYSDSDINDIIKKSVFNISKNKQYLSIKEKKLYIDRIFNSMRRLDIIQPLFDDPEITEIMINGKDKIFIEKAGHIEETSLSFENIEKLEDLIQIIVSKVNRSVNESNPIADARLQDGSRVNIVLPPIAIDGPIITIRRFPISITIEKLIELNSITEEMSKYLEQAVISKKNIFISGGTGTGKTTFLNALSNFIPENERVVTIEDSAELKISNIKNLVRLEARQANSEGKGEITIRDLIKTSLRMRPERIIVGEVRGPEAIDMLQAMNTGHKGSLSTGHANSTRDMLSRLETMVLMGSSLPIEAIRRQIGSAIDIFIHLCRQKDGTRKVSEISETFLTKNSEIILNPIYTN